MYHDEARLARVRNNDRGAQKKMKSEYAWRDSNRFPQHQFPTAGYAIRMIPALQNPVHFRQIPVSPTPICSA